MSALRVCLLLIAAAAPAAAQSRLAARVGPPPAPDSAAATVAGPAQWLRAGERSPARETDAVARSSPWAILASAVVPGSGQLLLGQARGVAYLTAELYAWARFAVSMREGRRQRARYRVLASEVARAPLSPTRPVADFEYYEAMEHFVESGGYDRDPGETFLPEPDTATYNGSIWFLARQTYWEDPSEPPDTASAAYKSAIAFYRGRAVGPAFLWSWRGAEAEYGEFKRTIRLSNDAFRRSLMDVGIVIANHALSTVDAFVTVRLRRRPGQAGYEIGGSLPFDERTVRR